MSDKNIRFIDSEYRELFRIPDGGSIRITYPPGDGREPIVRACKYIDEYHFNLSGCSGGKPSYGTTYHICEFAEAMERIGAKYEPLEQLLDAELHHFTAGEERFFNRNMDEGNTCIGLISAEFGRQGDRFQHNWTGIDESRNTSQFQKEIPRVIYALRQDLLKDNGAMEAYCKDHPAARLPGYGELEYYGFRLDTEARQYYIRCMLGQDSRVAIFAYNKPEPTLSLDQHLEAAEEVIVAAEIVPGNSDERKMFFRNTEEGNQCIGYMRGDFGRGGGEFHHSWFEQDSTRKTPEFQSEFQLIVDKLRRDVLKDLKTSRSFCASHPDARLPDRDGVYYGFKLETENRRYFVRATTLAQDYFYIFAYDKPAPMIEREQPAVKQKHAAISDATMWESSSAVVSWKALVENNSANWREDDRYRKHKDGSLYYIGGESGQYLRVAKGGLLAVGSYELAKPDIKNAVLLESSAFQFDSYVHAWNNALRLGGSRLESGLASAEKPSVVKQLRDAKVTPKPPRQRKTPAKGKNGAEL